MPIAAPYRLLLSVVAPPLCVACGAELRGSHEALCSACAGALPWLGETCPRCALPVPCGRCPAQRAAWTLAWAPFAHEGPARALVTALKFRGVLAAADLLAAPIAAGAPQLLAGAALVPVPADPARRRRRGFDHAGLIAAAVARRTGQPLVAGLQRPRAARQLGAGRQARLASAREAPPRPRGPVPRVAVLVDDVHTTGATLEACARALREAGAETVHAITATRSVG